MTVPPATWHDRMAGVSYYYYTYLTENVNHAKV